MEALLPYKATEIATELVSKLIQSEKQKRERPSDSRKIFISYTDKQENNNLIENFVRNFLKKLGFDPRTWRDARSSFPLKTEIDRLIEESSILIAFLTRDIPEQGTERFHPGGNIPGEIERALTLSHKVILFFEEGTTIPSNTRSYYCNPFVNRPESYAELFIKLLDALIKEDLLRLP